jgi:hypothetical protein
MKIKIDVFLNETLEILKNIMPISEPGERMDNIVATLRVDISCLLVGFGNDCVSFDLLDVMKRKLAKDQSIAGSGHSYFLDTFHSILKAFREIGFNNLTIAAIGEWDDICCSPSIAVKYLSGVAGILKKSAIMVRINCINENTAYDLLENFGLEPWLYHLRGKSVHNCLATIVSPAKGQLRLKKLQKMDQIVPIKTIRIRL